MHYQPRTATRSATNGAGHGPQGFAREQGTVPAVPETVSTLPPAALERGMSAETWRVMRRVFFPKAKSDETVGLVWDYCKAKGLDPMLRPFHIVPVYEKIPGGPGQRDRWEEVDGIWPAIAMYRITAHRTGEYCGMDAPVLGPMQDFKIDDHDDHGNIVASVTVTAPEWGELTVYRWNHGEPRAFTVKLHWLENYARRGRNPLPTPMWLKRPVDQFLKVLESAALRAAFPEVGGEPTAEEMEGRYRDTEDRADDDDKPKTVRRTSSRLDAMRTSIAPPTDQPMTTAPVVEGSATEVKNPAREPQPIPSGAAPAAAAQGGAPASNTRPTSGPSAAKPSNGKKNGNGWKLRILHEGVDVGYACASAADFCKVVEDNLKTIYEETTIGPEAQLARVNDLLAWNTEQLDKARPVAPQAWNSMNTTVHRILSNLQQQLGNPLGV
jgi:phage recombination protein Bet